MSQDATRRCEGLDGEKRTEEMPSNGGDESSNCSMMIRLELYVSESLEKHTGHFSHKADGALQWFVSPSADVEMRGRVEGCAVQTRNWSTAHFGRLVC